MATELYLIAPPDAEIETFSPLFKAVVATTQIAALLLPRGARDEGEYDAFVSEIGFIAQEAGCAVLIDGEPTLAIALGADGAHVEGAAGAVRAAMTALKPDLIVGAGGIVSRDDAMAKGELAPDYIMFGPLSGATAPEVREVAGWWAEAMQIPSVLSDPEATGETADANGCEFLAIGESVWSAADPVAANAAIADRLESGA
jgi:thiamine-phosphate pyrophosphorylase